MKNFFNDIKTKIAIFRTISLLKKLSKKNRIIFSPESHIGDTLFSCALIKELEKQENYNYKLVVSQKAKHIVERFNFKNVYYCSPRLDIARLCYTQRAKKLIEDKVGKAILIPYLWYFYTPETYNNSCMDLLTYIRKEVFKLKSDKPKIDYIEVKENKPVIDITKKFVIIIPYSLSANIPLSILEKIAGILNSKGYICYSNVTKNQKEISNTIRFDYSLDDLATISKYASAVIGVRTGAMDYIISHAKRIFAIYDNDKDYHMYNLKQWQTQCEIKEYLYSKNKDTISDIDKIIDDIINSIK